VGPPSGRRDDAGVQHAAPSLATPPLGREDDATERRGDVWRRHPADAARLIVNAVVLALLLGLAAVAPDAVKETSDDLVSLVRRIPDGIENLLLGVAQLLGLLLPVAVLASLLHRRRFRLAGAACVGAAGAALASAALQGWLDRTVPPSTVVAQRSDSWLTGAAFPSGTYVAAFTAAVLVLGAATTREWRRAGSLLIVVFALLRVVTAVAIPVNVVIVVALGAFAGSLVLVVLGSPVRRLGTDAVITTLRTIGVPAAGIREIAVGRHHSRIFRTVGPDGAPDLFVKLVGRDERAAELLQRALNALRVEGLENDQAERSASRIVRQEALAGLLAARAGVRVAPVAGVGETPEGDGLLALEPVAGRSFGDLSPAELDDGVLRRAFGQLGRLHRARIAHRRLDARSLLVDDDGEVHVLDLRWAEIGAGDEALAVDVVDLITSLAVLAGPERAVAAARAELPTEALAAALPLTQPLVLSPDTRRAAKSSPGLLEDVRHRLALGLGQGDVELARIQRLSVGRVVGWVGTGVLVFVALAFLSNWAAIADAIGEADWSYLPWMLLLSVLGYVGGSLSLIGAVPRPLPLLQTIEVMYAQSFLNRFTPANAGGMALRARYLQSHGSDLTVAAASVGLTSAASGVLQVVLLVVFAVWAGSSDSLRFEMPDPGSVLLLVFVLAVVVGAVLATPWGKRAILGTLWPGVRKALGELSMLARSPSKLALLFGGAGVSKLTTIAAFILSVRAFGVDDPSAHLALLYMTANTVASAAPTPGGLGAIEAALVAVLTGIGVDPAEALSIVLVFRLVTYWLPVLPSYVALRHLRRTGLV
jgi:glycosyltransferase 2 family protein